MLVEARYKTGMGLVQSPFIWTELVARSEREARALNYEDMNDGRLFPRQYLDNIFVL